MGAHIMAEEKYYTVEDIARIFGVTERTIRRYISESALEAVRIGGQQYRISQRALDEYVRRNSSRRERDGN